MQDYIDFARKNGIDLIDEGDCQFCGAHAKRGVHECIEIFHLGFQKLDLNDIQNHQYRFFIVDAHALQHPELHGQWSNHFHLTRLHLIFAYKVKWTYQMSPQLSEVFKKFKASNPKDKLDIPPAFHRGKTTSRDIKLLEDQPEACKIGIEKWANEVYMAWQSAHQHIDGIAKSFLNK